MIALTQKKPWKFHIRNFFSLKLLSNKDFTNQKDNRKLFFVNIPIKK